MDEIETSGLSSKKKGLRSVGDLITFSLDVYKDNYKSIIALSFFASLASIVSIVIGVFSAGVLSALGSSVFSGILVVIFSFVTVIALITFQLWGSLALIYAIINRTGFKESLNNTWGRKILSYLWLLILSGLAVAGGLLLIVVPGIVIGIFLSMYTYVFIAEDKKGMNALSRSAALVKGNFWGVLGRNAVMFILMMAFYIPVSALLGGENPSVFENLIQTILNLLFMPFIYIYSYAIYKDLVKMNGSKTKEEKSKTSTWLSVFVVLGVVCVGLTIAALTYLATLIPSFLNSTSAGDYGKGYENSMMVDVPSAENDANDAMRRSDLETITQGLSQYYLENSEYPESLSELNETYLLYIPMDPVNGNPYEYNYLGDDFEVCAMLSNGYKTCLSSETLQEDDDLTPSL